MTAEPSHGTEGGPDLIDGSAAPEPCRGVVGREIDGVTVLVERRTRRVFQLDRIGTLVWSCLDGMSTLDEIVTDLSDVFAADEATVRRDVLALVQRMGRAGLLANVDPEVPERTTDDPSTELPIGTVLADFTLHDIDHREVSLSDFGGRPVVLVNWSPNCAFCRHIAPALAELQTALDARGAALVLLAGSGAGFNRPVAEAHGLRCTILLRGLGHFENPFRGIGTPAAYLLDASGRVASRLANGANEVPILVREAAGLPPVIPASQGAGRSIARFLEEPVSS